MSADAVCAERRGGARTLVLRPGGETRRDAGRAGGAVGALRSIDASDAVVAPQRRSVGWCFFFNSLRGAPTSRGGMTTTIWRPRVRIDVPDVGDVDDKDTSREELTKKGTKRKRAPMHYGPCEHGVKPRSKCKVCSACPHGRQRSQCKECGGSGICEHGRERSKCKECGGSQYASTVVSALSARSAVGHQSASTVVSALSARSAVGASICEHGRERSKCKECGGGSICEHGRLALYMQGVRRVCNLRARSSAL